MRLKLIMQISVCIAVSATTSANSIAQTANTKTQTQTKSAASPNAPAALGPAKVISRPGLWETTSLGVLDNGASSQSIATRCITPQDLRTPEVLLPQHAVVGLTCKNIDVKFTRNKATWKVSCIGSGQAIEGDGTFTFAAQSQSGTSKLAHGVGGKTVRTEKTIKARFVSPCDAPPPS